MYPFCMISMLQFLMDALEFFSTLNIFLPYSPHQIVILRWTLKEQASIILLSCLLSVGMVYETRNIGDYQTSS